MKWFLRLRESLLAPLIPIVLATLVIAAFVGSQALVECRGGTVCAKTNVAALVKPDRSVRFDATGALVTRRDKFVPGDSARVRVLTIAAKRHTGRLVWVFFACLGVFSTVAALFIAWFTLQPAPEERPKWLGTRTAAIFAVSAGVGLLLVTHPRSHMNLLYDVVARSSGGPWTLGAVETAETIINRLNSAEQAASVALILACSMLLLPARRLAGAPTNDPETLLQRDLRPTLHRLRNLRVFLYGATVFLILGVFRMQASANWIVSFLHPAEAEAVGSILTTLSTVMGAFFSLILAAVYLPTAAILRARVHDAIAGSRAAGEFKKNVADQSGLGVPLGSSIARIAALLGPLLAGPIGSLFQVSMW